MTHPQYAPAAGAKALLAASTRGVGKLTAAGQRGDVSGCRARPLNRQRAKHTLLPEENTMRKLIIPLAAIATAVAIAFGAAATAQAAPAGPAPAHAHVTVSHSLDLHL
jgi:hypothetical protein